MRKYFIQLSMLATALFVVSGSLFAYKGAPKDGQTTVNAPSQVSYRMNCVPSTSEAIQNINNVRATLLAGGDVWWDLDDGRYYVPNVPIDPVSSIFAGSVWLGGLDDANQLKVAAQTYRQSGNDFWTGPLTEDLGTISADTCQDWDRHFTVLGEEIDELLRLYGELCPGPDPDPSCQLDPSVIPENVLYWPGRGNPYFSSRYGFELPDNEAGLGSFLDKNNNDVYEPELGEYPVIDIIGCEEKPPQYPDEMIFWIYNDNGNVHTQTNGVPIRMEVQVQAFAYRGVDELNDMTFQRYKLINRAPASIDSTFFAMWVDPDLGCADDDYIGCDTARELAYVYNSDDNDEACNGIPRGYGSEIPMLGVDYFRGPKDEFGVELGMSSFTYFNREGTDSQTDPDVALEYYRYLTGSWKDGTPFTYGGTGYDPLGDPIDFAFTEAPNQSLPSWSMCSEGLPAGDRRTLQASGPFRLDPGRTNELIVGVVWVPDMDYPCPDPSRLFDADEIAQGLFNACFDILDGPDAPDIDWVELDQELIAVFTNDVSSNNFELGYVEADPVLSEITEDTNYVFEGYKLFQLQNAEVSNADLDDPTKARVIYQADFKNGIGTIYNWNSVIDPRPGINEKVYVPELKVEALDQGLRQTFRITEDQFAEGEDNRLINHRRYYFLAVAYAYNNYEEFNPDIGTGQNNPYLEGRKNVVTYAPIPRPIVDRKLNAGYGDGPVITRLAGQGAGNTYLDLDEETIASIQNNTNDGRLTYRAGNGPLQIQVYNPLEVRNGSYRLEFVDEDMSNMELDDSVKWVLKDVSDGSILAQANSTIDLASEVIFPELGFSIFIGQTGDSGDLDAVENNGAIGVNLGYAGGIDSEPWFAGVGTADNLDVLNFIRTSGGEVDFDIDPENAFQDLGNNSSWFPYTLCDWREDGGGQIQYISPAWRNNQNANVRAKNTLQTLNNVDIVFTPNKDLWSRCVVVETASEVYYSSGGLGVATESVGGCTVEQFDLRSGLSVGKNDTNGDGKADPDNEINPFTGQPLRGMGWFPGYAYDVETGKRLNIFFGENSTLTCDNAAIYGIPCDAFTDETITRDMMWNPNGQFTLDGSPPFINFNFPTDALYLFLGGQHFIYVTSQEYDSCMSLLERMDCDESEFKKISELREVTWTAMPFASLNRPLESLDNGLIPEELTVQLRVDNPYAAAEGTGEFNGHNAYEFRFDGVEADPVDSQTEIDAALDMINVVPNPYYGFSTYEQNANTTVIKVTNLPAKCTITIYSLDGRFIRRYNRDEIPISQLGRTNPGIPVSQIVPDLEWDLRNSAGIPIGSGVYLFHIDAGELGERVIKWFGTNRQFDPTGL